MIRLFGLQRSGTNVIQQLVERNFPQVTVRSDGKHGPFRKDDAGGYLLIVKEPWAWLDSVERWKAHDVWSLPRRAWYRLRGRSMEHHDARHRFIEYLRALDGWRRSLPDPLAVVQYRDLLVRRDEVLGGVGSVLDLEVGEGPFQGVEARVEPSGDRADEAFDPTPYVERSYLDRYHPEEVERLLAFAERNWVAEALSLVGMDLAALLDDPEWGGFPDRAKV